MHAVQKRQDENFRIEKFANFINFARCALTAAVRKQNRWASKRAGKFLGNTWVYRRGGHSSTLAPKHEQPECCYSWNYKGFTRNYGSPLLKLKSPQKYANDKCCDADTDKPERHSADGPPRVRLQINFRDVDTFLLYGVRQSAFRTHIALCLVFGISNLISGAVET